MKARFSTAFILMITVAILSGCASWGVQPWDRDLLSKKEMQFGAQGLEEGSEDHIYFSKEGSSGGRGFSAGGCGCN